jgi:small subunit ribosomal protein S20
LAHSKSALKRWRQSIERRDRNRAVKSRTRTLLTKALASIDDDAAAAEDAVRGAISALDKAAQKGVIHANAAARSKSRLLKRLNLAVASAVAAAASAAAVEEKTCCRIWRRTHSPEPAAQRRPEPAPRRPSTRPRPAWGTTEVTT